MVVQVLVQYNYKRIKEGHLLGKFHDLETSIRETFPVMRIKCEVVVGVDWEHLTVQICGDQIYKGEVGCFSSTFRNEIIKVIGDGLSAKGLTVGWLDWAINLIP